MVPGPDAFFDWAKVALDSEGPPRFKPYTVWLKLPGMVAPTASSAPDVIIVTARQHPYARRPRLNRTEIVPEKMRGGFPSLSL